jgi:hypothetical protein
LAGRPRGAQVGNDYSLLGAGYAAAIDAHDTVLRLAGNSLHGYERYVGGKTDATYMAYDCQVTLGGHWHRFAQLAASSK